MKAEGGTTTNSGWCRYDSGRRTLTLTLHIQPNARVNAIAGRHGDALKVRVAAPAVDDKANLELLAYLRELLDVPASAIAIRHGARGRRKVVEVSGALELAARLERLVQVAPSRGCRVPGASSLGK